MFVFDKNLNLIDTFVGYSWLKEVNRWLVHAISNLDDSLLLVKKRVDERLEGSLWRTVQDLFASNESIKSDNERALKYLKDSDEEKIYIEYLNKLKPLDYQQKIAKTLLMNVLWGEGELLEKENIKKEEWLKQKTKEFLQSDKEHDWFYSYLLQQECTPHDEKNKKSLPPSIDCKSAIEEQIVQNNQKTATDKDISLEVEKLFSQASNLEANAELKKLLKANQQAEANYKQCADLYAQLSKFSPLRGKSRVARIYSLYCLKELKNGASSEKVLISLTKDFPYDSTFYQSLSKHYLKTKKYKKAMAANEEALTYAYGNNWVRARILKSEIEKAMGQKSSAKQTLLDTLSELNLEKDDERTQLWVSRLRSQLDQLSQDKKK